MNTTILQLVAIYKIQLHVSALYVGHYQVVQRTYYVPIQYVVILGGGRDLVYIINRGISKVVNIFIDA